MACCHLCLAAAFALVIAAIGHAEPRTTDIDHQPTNTTQYSNQHFGSLTVNGGSSVVLRNCSVHVLKLEPNATALHLLIEDSVIGSVGSDSGLLGNVTIVACDIGNENVPNGILFPEGTHSNSTLTVISTSITAAGHGLFFGDSFGRVSLVDSRVTMRGDTPTIGVHFNGVVGGPVSLTRLVVDAASSSPGGTTAVYFATVRAGIHLVDCELSAFSDTGRGGGASGLQVGVTDAGGCVYTTGGSVVGHCGATTRGITYGALFHTLSGGAVTFEGTNITSSCFGAYGFLAQAMNTNSIVLMRAGTVTAIAPVGESVLKSRAFSIAQTSGDAVTVLDATTLRAPRGSCLFFDHGFRAGLVDLRGVDLAECGRNLLDFRGQPLTVSFQQNCLRIDGKATDEALGDPSTTTVVFPCVNNTPRTTAVRTDVSTAEACTAFGSISPFEIAKTVTLRGNVTRSSLSFGDLVIEDPETVSLTNVEATSITFTKSAEGPVLDAPIRVSIDRCQINDRMHFGTAFTDMSVEVDGSTMGALDTKRLQRGSTALHASVIASTVSVTGSQSLKMSNCTVMQVVLQATTADLHLMAVASTLGSVTSSLFSGNVTFVACNIGNENVPNGILFPEGTHSNSTLTVISTSITAAGHGLFFGDSFGRVSLVDSRVTMRGDTPTIGVHFNGVVGGPVSLTRLVVDAASSSPGGTTAVYFATVRAGIHLVDCELSAFSDTGRGGGASGLQVGVTDAGGCVYTTGGSVVGHCGATTRGITYGALFHTLSGGAVTFEGTNITSSCFGAYGFLVQAMTTNSIVLMRAGNVTAVAPAGESILNSRAFSIAQTSGDAVTVLDVTTLRAPRGTCLFFDSGFRAGLVDLRGVDLAECGHNLVDFRGKLLTVSFEQNCCRIRGNNTDKPLGPSTATVVFPCVNNTPRTAVVVTPAATAQACTTFGSISPFAIARTVTLRGNVTRSSGFVGALVIEDPETVSLTGIEATSITFNNTQASSASGGEPARIRISMHRCRIRGSVRFAATFSNVELIVEHSAVDTGLDTESIVPLLSIGPVQRGSILVRSSTFTGRRMFYSSAAILNSTIAFHDTQFFAPRYCINCASVALLEFAGQLSRSNVTFDACSLRSVTQYTNADAPRVAISFRSLSHARVFITDTEAQMQYAAISHFLDLVDYDHSCVTVVNSSVVQTCSNSTSAVCRQSEPSYFVYSHRAPTGASFLTLHRVNITMATFSAAALFLPYLQNIDVVMWQVHAMIVSQTVASYFFDAKNAESAVVALLDSTVSVSRAYAYRFSSVDHRVSLLNLRNNFTVLQIMHDEALGSSLNARQGCDLAASDSLADLGAAEPSTQCADSIVTPSV